MAFNVGDPVEIELDDGEEQKFWIVGKIVALTDYGVQVNEGHAMHSLWGGSSAGRGKIHTFTSEQVKPVRGIWRHLSYL